MGSLLLIFLDVPSLAPGSLVDSFDFRCGNSKAQWRHVNSTSTIGRPLTEKAGFIRVSPLVFDALRAEYRHCCPRSEKTGRNKTSVLSQ